MSDADDSNSTDDPATGATGAGRAPAGRILITGFGPFPDVAENPSGRLAEALADPAAGIEAMVLPVSFARAPRLLAEALADLDPDMWIGLGVSRPAPPTLILETLARNRMTSERADVDGAVAKGSDVDPQGPPALPSRLPLTAIRRALRQAGHAHSLSDDAGGYVCNAVFYAGLRAMPEGRPGGFVHVPMCDADGFQALRVATESLLDALVHHRTGERPDK